MRSCEERGGGGPRRAITLFQLSGRHDLTFRLSQSTEIRVYQTGDEGSMYFRKITFN